MALPKGHTERERLRPGAQVVRTPQSVRFTAERRHAVNEALDTFIPAAVERHHPLRALPLVTHDFRAGATRDQWSRGDLPVMPYDARAGSFHGWRLNYSFPKEISVELLLHPAPKEPLGAVAFTAVFKRVHNQWLIDSFAPSASFAPVGKAARIKAQPDYTPFQDTRGNARLSTRWLLVPAAVLALIVLVPVGLGIAHLRRSRRAWRSYRASLD